MTIALRHYFACLLILLLLPLAACNAQERYKEGTHYELLSKPVPTSTDDKIEVVELFWYGCPHCFNLEPQVADWLSRKPDNVEFVRIPAVLGKHWEIGARAYYIADHLGVLEQTHQALFDAIHVDGKTIDNEEQLAEFFADQGVDQAAFDKANKAFGVQTKLGQNRELMRRYQVRGVPALIVNGKYKTNNFDVVDYLIGLESSSG